MQAQRITEYKRPKSSTALTKGQRERLLNDYFDHYRGIAATNQDLLNQKLPRSVFEELLDALGGMLLGEAKALAVKPGPVRDFLERNSLPPSLAELLPPTLEHSV